MKRPKPAPVELISPFGELHQVNPDNVRDLMQHGGWRHPHQAPRDPVSVDDDLGAVVASSATPAEPQEPASTLPPTSRLQTARQSCRDRGIAFDPQMGIRALEALILAGNDSPASEDESAEPPVD